MTPSILEERQDPIILILGSSEKYEVLVLYKNISHTINVEVSVGKYTRERHYSFIRAGENNQLAIQSDDWEKIKESVKDAIEKSRWKQ